MTENKKFKHECEQYTLKINIILYNNLFLFFIHCNTNPNNNKQRHRPFNHGSSPFEIKILLNFQSLDVSFLQIVKMNRF